eukprot:gene5560-4197_t
MLVHVVQVISFILDAKSRLFDTWYPALNAPPRPSSRGKILDRKGCLELIEAMELFGRLLAARIGGLNDQLVRKMALRNVGSFEQSTPRDVDVISLGVAEDLPTISESLDAYDMDYQLYRSLVLQDNNMSGLDDLPTIGESLSSYDMYYQLYRSLDLPTISEFLASYDMDYKLYRSLVLQDNNLSSMDVQKVLHDVASPDVDPTILRLAPYYRKHLAKEIKLAQAKNEPSDPGAKRQASPYAKLYPTQTPKK